MRAPPPSTHIVLHYFQEDDRIIVDYLFDPAQIDKSCICFSPMDKKYIKTPTTNAMAKIFSAKGMLEREWSMFGPHRGIVAYKKYAQMLADVKRTLAVNLAWLPV